MNKPILSLIFSLAITLGSTLNGQTSFSNLYGSVNGEAGERVVPLSAGGYLIAGSTDDAMFGWKDIFVTKVNAVGNLVWSKKLGTSDQDRNVKIVENPLGGCYVLFSKYDPWWVSPYAAAMVVGIDANGNITMTKKIWDASRHVWASDLVATSSGGVTVLATTDDYASQFSGRAEVISLASNGNFIWSKTYSQSVIIGYGELVQCSGGDYIVAATSFSPSFQYSHLLFRINSSGSLVWSSESPLSNQNIDFPSDLVVAGNCFLMVTLNGHLHYFTQSGASVWSRKLTNSSWSDYFQVDYSNGRFCVVGLPIIFEVDTTGNMLSTGVIYQNTNTWITDVRYLPGGDVVLTGWVGGGFNAQDTASVLLMRGGVSLGNLCGYSFQPIQLVLDTLVPSAITITSTTLGSVTNATLSSSSGTLVLPSCLVSVQEQEERNVVKLYPSPATDFFVIESSSINNGQCLLYNSIGELVLVEQIIAERTEVACSNLLPGMYFYSVMSDGEVIDRGKIIKQ